MKAWKAFVSAIVWGYLGLPLHAGGVSIVSLGVSPSATSNLTAGTQLRVASLST